MVDELNYQAGCGDDPNPLVDSFWIDQNCNQIEISTDAKYCNS